MNVLFSPEIRLYFQDLVEVLLEREYFSFEDSAIQYVRTLMYEIRDTLPLSMKRSAPKHFDRYGKNMYYSTFRKNNNTQWYVFFHQYEQEDSTVYLVRYISNNHMIAQHL